MSEEHYNTYLARLKNGEHRLNAYIEKELGDISGEDVIHLQCNTGADTMLLAKTAKSVTGVDLVPANIEYAGRMAKELGIDNVDFIASDVLKASEVINKKYDIVFTSEGVPGWLPELRTWAKTVRALMKDTGGLYVFDSHPFYLAFDEGKLAKSEYDIKYPYFGSEPDVSDTIGGYAGKPKKGEKSYFWMHTFSELINSLSENGLRVDMLNEFPENYFNGGGMRLSDKQGLYEYPYNKGLFPISYSLWAFPY